MDRNFTAASQIGVCGLASLLLLVTPAPAQTGNTIVGPPISVAPGSITNLVVVGVGSKLTAPVTANGFPLPTTLAGISVTLHQSANPQSIPAPILAVTPMSSCANHFPLIHEPCGQYTMLTIQIPFELWIPLPEAPPKFGNPGGHREWGGRRGARGGCGRLQCPHAGGDACRRNHCQLADARQERRDHGALGGGVGANYPSSADRGGNSHPGSREPINSRIEL